VKFNYCEVCGAKAKDEMLGRFDRDTGKMLYRSVCSENPCHTGHDERCLPFSFNPFKQDWYCARCGKKGFWPGL